MKWWRFFDRRTASSSADPWKSEAPVLLTGAAGLVASAIRPFLAREHVSVRLSDIRPVGALSPNESWYRADLRDRDAVANAARGCSAIVHFGGIAKDRGFEQIVDVDMRGVANVLDAAVSAGIERVVLASSMHVLGFYRRDEPVSPSAPPRPDSRYAVARAFAELAGALYARKHGLRVTCLRLGHVTSRREDAEPGSWVAPEDVALLVRLGLAHPDIRFEIVHAVAPYDGDDGAQIELADRLGFRFRHAGTSYRDAMDDARRYFSFEPRAIEWRGGVFAARDGEPGV